MSRLFIAFGVVCIIAWVFFSVKSISAKKGSGKNAAILAAVFTGLSSILSFLIATGVIPLDSSKISVSNNTAPVTESNNYTDGDTNAESLTFLDFPFSETENTQGAEEAEKINNPTKETNDVPINLTDVILNLKGEIKKEDQEDSYSIHTDRSGTDRFEISGLNAEKKVSMCLKDVGGGEMFRNTWIENGEGITANDLEAGKTYYVIIQQATGFTPYTLIIGKQQQTIDINGSKSIGGEIVFTDQVNKYSFTPAICGTYRFEVEDLYAEKKISMFIIDEGGGVVIQNTWIENGEGITTDQLQAHHPYLILIQQAQGLSKYTLKIGYQTETKNVFADSVETDAITFRDQVNIYSFTPRTAKQYRFEINDVQCGKKVSMLISDQGGGNLEKNTWIENGEGISTEQLKVGEEYFIKIVYANGCTPYSLIIK